MPGLRIDPERVETNIVIAEVERGEARLPRFMERLEAEGVKVLDFGGPGCFRAVTHLDVDDAALERAIAAMRSAAGAAIAR